MPPAQAPSAPAAGRADLVRGVLAHGIAWILVSEFLFAVMRVATRLGAADLSGIEIGAVRFLGGAVVAFAIARSRGASLRVVDQKNAWLRSLFGTANAAAVFYVLGSGRIAVGDVATLSGVGPLFVALLSFPVLRERVSRRVALGAVVGFVGVAVLVKPVFHLAGDLASLAVAGAFFYALAMLRLRKLGPRESSEAIAFHMSLVAGVTLSLLALPHFRVPSRGALLPLAVSVAAGGLAQLAMSRAYALDRAARLSALAYAGVVFTYALESLMWGRLPDLRQWLGAGLVCLSGAVVSWRRPVPAAPAPGA